MKLKYKYDEKLVRQTKLRGLLVRLFHKTWMASSVSVFAMFALSVLMVGVVRADPPSAVLDVALTKVTDGTAPFPAVDPNGTNGLVATLDSARYTFDVSVDPVDGVPSSVTNLTIVGTLDTATSEVSWMRNSANIAAITDVCNTRTVSVDGKTMTCVVNGPVATSTTLNIQAAWFATSAAPNNEEVTVSFTTSATDPSAADDPLPATSSDDTLTVVIDGEADYEVRKVGGNTRIESAQRDPLTGAPLFVDANWNFQVEVVPQNGNLKGVSTVDLGDLSFIDNLEAPTDTDQMPLSTLGELVSCGAVNDNYVAGSSGSNSNDNVENSGSWTCNQPGGAGTDITIGATGIEWAPRWYPDRFGPGNSPLSASQSQFRFGVVNSTNEIYNSPTGENNRAVVATQRLTMRYPYQDVKDFDQTAGDQDVTVNEIIWCNQIDNVDVVGALDGVDDPSNNVACTPLFSTSSGVGVDTVKGFLRSNGTTITVNDLPNRDLGLKRGVYGPSASEQYIQPGQDFRIRYSVHSAATSVEGLANVVACDSIETSQYSLRAHSATTMTSYTTGGTHDYYSWHYKAGASGFPAITDSDVVVEFTNAGSLSSNADQRDVDCDGSYTWETDPTLVAGGIGAVNLVRTRIINDKQIAPGGEVMTVLSATADDGVVPGDKLRNFYQYKFDVDTDLGSYQRATSTCDLESSVWAGSSSNVCRSLADRLYVLGASGNLQVRDVGDANPNDWIISKAIGSQWTYTMYAGMTNITDVNINNVEVFQLVEPGFEYISSTLQPDLIVQDCNANTNPTCLTNPAARTNIGFTTLKWELGDFSFVNPSPGNTYNDYTAFGQWDVTVQISPYIANGSTITNRGWLQADGLENLTSPVNFPSCPIPNDLDTYSGPLDEDCVTVTNPNVFAIEKYVVEDQEPYNDRLAEIPLEGIVKYNLAYANTAGSAKVMDAIDVLPYNGDGRFPASDIDGSYSVTKAEATTNPGLLNQIYITSDSPASINSDPNDAGNTAVGQAGRWLCTYAQRGTGGCPAEDEITGLRFISNSMTSGQYGFIRVELTTQDNDGEELYTNTFQARATGMALPVNSSDVTATTPACLSVGNLVFFDANKNGIYDEGDTGFDGVDVDLVRASDDEVYKTTVSDEDGRWYINCIPPGDYYVRLGDNNFGEDGPLSGYVPAPAADEIPVGMDEDVSHDLLDQEGVFRSGTFTLSYGSGPTGETGDNFGDDDNDDLTIDLGLVLSAVDEPPVDPPTDTPGTTGGNQDSNNPLSTTGAVISLAALITLFVSLAMLHHFRQRAYYRVPGRD